MQHSFIPFVLSFLLSQRLQRFSKINKHEQWVKWFRYAKYFSVFLFASELLISASDIFRWIWLLLLILLIAFAVQQKEMRPLRMFLLAFAPYVAVMFLTNFTEILAKEFYTRWSNYYDNALMLAVIWLVAILFSQYRKNKEAEKERIKRLKEDEINRAIAVRKVELEGLVAERTAELTQQKEELQHTLNELRNTQAQLIQSEKMASLGELTAGIAHEIQNPLNFVNNFAEINKEFLEEMIEEIEKGNLEEAKQLAKDLIDNEQKINFHGKRADGIVKGMLQHSRKSSGVKEPTDINALADEYLRLAYHGLRAKDKSFNAAMLTDFDESVGKINVVPQDIGRVILNLITNAFYAVSSTNPSNADGTQETLPVSNPTVWVSTKKESNKVLIVVKDNGPGIPKSALDKIFQPFFTTKPTGSGTGLGLSLSYDIIQAHGGKISVSSKENKGTEFIISIPIIA